MGVVRHRLGVARVAARRDEHLRNEAGATLTELMAGVVITLLVAAAGFTVLTSSEKAATVNEQTAQTQQNGRVAMELVARDLKMAGFGLVSGGGTINNCTAAGSTVPILPLDNTPAGADTGPDSVRLVVPTRLSTLNGQHPAAPPAAITQLALQAGAVASMGITTNQSVSVNGAASGNIQSIAGDTLTLTNPIAAPALFPGGTVVYWMQCITYAITSNATKCAGSGPCLLRGIRDTTVADINLDPNMVPIADGIEDLQLAYACDGCTGTAVPDGIVDDQNANGNFDAGDFISNNAWATAPMTPEKIRLVRVTVVARQPREDLGLGEGKSEVQATGPVIVEDHNPSSDAGFVSSEYSHFRRRVLTRTVQLRNVGL